MSSYDHFCLLQHIRSSAFPYINSSAILPSAEGLLRDALAETCYLYAQNLPTIVTLLPHAGLAIALLISFFSPENLPGGLSLSDVDQSNAHRDGTFFDKNTGALSTYAKCVLIANAAWAAWSLVLLFSWLGLWIFSGYGCAGLCGPRTRWEEEEVGRATSIRSEKSESGLAAAMGASGADALPWSWKECTLLRVYEACEFCLTLRSAERPSEGGFEGIKKVFAAVGLGGAAQPARRGMLSQDLFESPNGAQSRRSSAANGHRNGQEGITPPPEALVHEKSMAEGEKNAPLKDLPYPSEQEQIPFPPSPAVPEEIAGGHDDDEQEGEGDIVVEVEDDEGEEEEEEEGNINPRSSEEPSSFSGRASNSLSSLGQPIPSRYPFAFHYLARGGSMSSTGSPPFAFSRAIATPQSKSTSTRESHETRSTGNVETMTTSSSPSGGSPTSAVSPTSSVPSPQGVRGMPIPPRHPAAAGGRQRPSTAPSPEHRRQLRHSIGSEDERPPRSGQPSPDGSLKAREREGLLAYSLHLHLGQVLGHHHLAHAMVAQLLPHESVAFSAPALGSGSPSGGSSRHNSHVSGIGGASRSSIELVLGHMPGSPPATGAVHLGDTSDVNGSEGALSNPESHTFGLPVVGGAGSLLPRRAAVHAHTLEGDPGWSSVSVSSSSSAAAATAAVAAAMTAHARSARGQVVSPEPRNSSLRARSSNSLSSAGASGDTATIGSLVWVAGFAATATTGGRDTAIAVDYVAVHAI
ncbi:hypothetical protein V8E52_006647 [Russula decolorans]